MKKVILATAVASVALLSACNNGSPKANMRTGVDTLSYEIGLSYSEQAKGQLAPMGVDSAYVDEFIKGVKDGTLAEDDKKKMAYYMGILFGLQSNMQLLQGVERQAFAGDTTQKLSRKNYLAGLVAGLKDKSSLKIGGKVVDPRMAYELASAKINELSAKAMAKQYASEKSKNEQFLSKNAKAEGVRTLQGGVQYRVLKEGTGAIPKDTATVSVLYEGRLIDGKVFDSTDRSNKGKPAEFPVNGVVKGLGIALTHMPVGSTWEIFIPYNLGYGEQGNPQIPPFSTLIFKVTLVGIK